MDNVREIVKGFILEQIASGDGAEDIADDTNLKDSGILDSLSTWKLVSFVEQAFHIEVNAADLKADRLTSLRSIVEFVAERSEKQQ